MKNNWLFFSFQEKYSLRDDTLIFWMVEERAKIKQKYSIIILWAQRKIILCKNKKQLLMQQVLWDLTTAFHLHVYIIFS